MAECLFQNPGLSYFTLTSRRIYSDLFQQPPKHALSIPAEYADNWGDDYQIQPDDFLPRPIAISDAADANKKALSGMIDDNGLPLEWTLVFRDGGWKSCSHLHLNFNGGEILSIDTRVTLVRPTAAEVRQYASTKAAA